MKAPCNKNYTSSRLSMKAHAIEISAIYTLLDESKSIKSKPMYITKPPSFVSIDSALETADRRRFKFKLSPIFDVSIQTFWQLSVYDLKIIVSIFYILLSVSVIYWRKNCCPKWSQGSAWMCAIGHWCCVTGRFIRKSQNAQWFIRNITFMVSFKCFKSH